MAGKRLISRKWFALFLAFSLILSSLGGVFAATGSDIQGHWAEEQLRDWVAEGHIKGYSDGTIRPDNPVTRAEFVTLVNRVFGFQESDAVQFSDVQSSDWHYQELGRAIKAGYINGYADGTFRADNRVSRQEVAVMISKVLDLNVSTDVANRFVDRGRIADWSYDAVSTVAAGGVMGGYVDGTFRPDNFITRAEAVVTIDRAYRLAQSTIYDEPGTYGPESGSETIEGNVAVLVAGVTLRNLTITGDLLLAEGIGEGDVTLENVTVRGTTTVKGGGENSIYIINSELFEVIVDKATGNVRIVASGSTAVNNVQLNTGAILEEEDLTGDGFENIVVQVADDGTVILSGNFANVQVDVPNVAVELRDGTIDVLTVTENAEGARITIDSSATVNKLNLNADTDVDNQGTIRELNDNSEGSNIETGEPATETPETGGSRRTTSLSMSADDVTTFAGEEFEMPVTAQGRVASADKSNMVRFYGVISDLEEGDIDLSEIEGGEPEIVRDKDERDKEERKRAGAGKDDLVLAWGPKEGFPLGDLDYSEGVTTKFKAMIEKAGVYTVRFVFYDITAGKQLNGVNEEAVITVLDIGPTTGVQPSTEDPISGKVTFEFGFKSAYGSLEELELDIYLGNHAGEDNRDYSEHLGINLPAGEAEVAMWVDGLDLGEVGVDSKYSALLAAAGYDSDKDDSDNKATLKENISYTANGKEGTWTLTLDTAVLLGEEIDKIEFLVTVKDNLGAQWGNNNYTAYPEDVKGYLYKIITEPKLTVQGPEDPVKAKDEQFTVTFTVLHDKDLEYLEIDHNLGKHGQVPPAEVLPEFKLYPNKDNPWAPKNMDVGEANDRKEVASEWGLTASYDDENLEWTLKFAGVALEEIRKLTQEHTNEKFEIYALVKDVDGYQSGSMYDGSYVKTVVTLESESAPA